MYEKNDRTTPAIAPGYMRAEEAARYMAVSRRCLSEWQRRRLVPFIRAGKKCILFRRTDLDRALDRLTVKAAGHERA